MDFIEQWFGVAPDGGNGTLEALCIAVSCIGLLIVAGYQRVVKFGRCWIVRG